MNESSYLSPDMLLEVLRFLHCAVKSSEGEVWTHDRLCLKSSASARAHQGARLVSVEVLPVTEGLLYVIKDKGDLRQLLSSRTVL